MFRFLSSSELAARVYKRSTDFNLDYLSLFLINPSGEERRFLEMAINYIKCNFTAYEINEWLTLIDIRVVHSRCCAVVFCLKQGGRIVIFKNDDQSLTHLFTNSLENQLKIL